MRTVTILIIAMSALTAAADGAADPGEEALRLIAIEEARLPGLKDTLASACADGIPVAYPLSDLTVGELFCGWCRDDVARGRKDRALTVAQEVKDILDRAEREMQAGVDVPVWQVGSQVLREGSFWGTCLYRGVETVRPVIFTGYGHFGGVVNALPTLQKTGSNIIQIEIGPRHVVNEDGTVRSDGIDDYILPALDRARDHGATVCLLLSPHYFPGWAVEKWPELRVDNGMFLKNSLEAPQAREIYARFLRTVIPIVKDHPALHSVCLSNEPTSSGSDEDPWRLPLWREYIRELHGDIATVNALYDTDYTDFDEVPHPSRGLGANRSAFYDGIRFNQDRFSEWHAWMADIIHESAPRLACHVKVMPIVWGRRTITWGTDPWQFAELSQLNGNDCYFLPNNETAPWESEWQLQNMYYDLQRSMKRAPVFNTENHIISDRETAQVYPGHIYTALWQGAVHGQGAETTWSWGRTYDRKSDFEGLTLHRPGCTAAHSRAGLDLMRLAPEVTAFHALKPRVAILHSNAAIVWDTGFYPSIRKVYEALNFCGVPIGFVTDEQAAAGWLKKYDVLIVPDCAHVLGGASDAIRTWSGRGGVVVAHGTGCLAFDQYGRPSEEIPFQKQFPADREGKRLRNDLSKALRKAGIGPETKLRGSLWRMPYGVEWRTAALNGRTLINMVNLTREPIKVALPKGTWQDLITLGALGGSVTLDPNTPVLAVSE
ncbi:MAG: hypothetical protein GY851_07500 [bacterium]|nr:hypothetical protein [bacterium]